MKLLIRNLIQLIVIVLWILLIARAINHSQFDLVAGYACFGAVYLGQRLANKKFPSPSVRLRIFRLMCWFCILSIFLFSALDWLNILPRTSGFPLAALILLGLTYSEFRKSSEQSKKDTEPAAK
jgi:hypothetical protein